MTTPAEIFKAARASPFQEMIYDETSISMTINRLRSRCINVCEALSVRAASFPGKRQPREAQPLTKAAFKRIVSYSFIVPAYKVKKLGA